jgi:Transposase DDE domain
VNDTILQQFRQQVYESFEQAGDALFNLADALLCESQARSLPELSFSVFFERQWPSVYEALEDGRITVEKVRAANVSAVLAQKREDEPLSIAVDTTTIERPDASCSQDRGIIHVSNLPLVEKPLGVGWTVSSVVLVPDAPRSWVPILEQQRVKTEQTPIQGAIAQVRALRPLFGERYVTVLADRGYATPEFLRACSELGDSVLVRIKSDRRLSRPGVRIHQKGPAPKDGPLLQGKRQQTHGEPEESCREQDHKGKWVQTSGWSNLHFRQDRELLVKMVRVERESAQGTKRDPGVSWFVVLDNPVPLGQIAAQYARRFSHEHGSRFLKQDLLWTQVHVRTPEQFERWSWVVAIVFTQLYLARERGQAQDRPWEHKDRPLTPRQVRRVMPTLLLQLGTPTRPCRPRGKSPGRAPGFRPQPAARFPVVITNTNKARKTEIPRQSSA